MGRRLVLLPLLGLLALGYAAKCPKQRTSPGREILCYTTTNVLESLQDSICRCTTLVHQGHDLQDLSTSGIEDFQKSLKEMNPVLQFVLSISDTQGSLKTSARVRQEAAARIVRVLNEVDGVELNVTAGTKERLVHFIQGLKTEMVRKSKEKRILLVLPTKTEELAKHFDIKALSKYVDLFTIPTHYLVDDDEAFRTFHPSRLMGLFDMLNADSLVDLVTGLGATKRKILVSLPASAYKFTLEKNEDNAPRAPTKEKQPKRISRTEMCQALDEGEWIVERDEDLTAPYTFMDNSWIAFEDKISAGIKGRYVVLRDLAGLGIHNVEHDAKTKCGNSLTEEVYHSFTDNKRKTREAVLSSLQEDLQQTHNTYPNHVKSSGYRIVRVVDTDGHIHAARENTKTEFSCPRQGYFVHPKSCNRFYRCVKFNQGVDDYSVFEFDCPAGLAFDEHTEVCVWPGSISACSGSSEIAPSKGPKFTCPDHPGYYRDPQNCRFFYACYDLGEHELTAYEFRCPYGLVFDEEKLICEWPYLVPSCGGTYERHDYDHGEHGGYDGHGGFEHGGHGGYDEHGGSEHGGHGGYDEHGGSEHGGHGGYDEHGGSEHGGHGGYDEHGGHGGYDEHGGSEHGGHGGHDEHGGSEHGGHGGYDEHGGHGGYDGHGGSEHGGHGGYDEHGGSENGGHGGYDVHGDSEHGEHGGYDEHGGSKHGDHGGHDEHGGSSEGGHGGYDGHGDSEHGGHGGYDQHGGSKHGGHGGHDEHGGSSEGGHGGYDEHGGSEHGGHGGHDEHGGSSEGGHGGYDEHGGSSEGGHGGYDEHGGSSEGGHGGYGEHGGSSDGGHGGYDEHGGSSDGGHGEYDEHGHGGDGGYEGGHGGGHEGHHGGHEKGHGASSEEEHKNGHGGSLDGEYGGGHGVTVHGGHGGSLDGEYGGGHGVTIHGGHGGSVDGEYGGGHGVTIHGGHGGSIDGEYGGNHGVTIHSGHGGHTESGQEGTHSVIIDSTHGHGDSNEGRYTESYHGEHGTTQSGIKGGYTISTQHGYTKYPVTSRPEHTPAVETGGGHGYQTSTIHDGYTTIDTGVHTGITSGYEAHTPTIQYGGHTGTAVTHAIGHTSSYDGSSDEKHAGVAIHHGNFGVTGSGEYISGSSHTGSSGVSSEIATGAYNVQNAHRGQDGSSGIATGSYSIQHSHRGQGGSSGIATGSYGGQNAHRTDGGYTILEGTNQHGTFGTGGYTGGQGGHTTIIQHGGHAVTQENSKGQGLGNFATSGKTGPNKYPGNFGPTGSGGYGGSTYSHGNGDGSQFTKGGYAGSTTYHGNFGSTGGISSGHATHGIIGTDVLTSGTVYTHGDSSGTVVGGTNYQGGIITGKTQPGYVQTHAGAPGYVVNNGVKTVYPYSGSQGTLNRGIPHEGVVISGAPEPGVVLTGQLTPGTYLKGQTAPGIIHGGGFTPGVTVGDASRGSHYNGGTGTNVYTGGPGVSIYNGGTGTSIYKGGADSSIYRGSGGQTTFTSGGKSYPKNPFLTVNEDMGYKTNEYHDNGGRGTIRYNNGEVIHKFTEDDVKDHRNQYGTLPTFEVGSYKATTENQNYQSSRTDGVYTQGGFTKTGPTKTGITTAQVGGSGTYVAGSPRPRPFANSDNIGANAFGASKTSSNQGYATSTRAPNLGYESSKTDYSSGSIDTSHTNTGSSNRGSGSGYTYTKPKVQLNTFGATGSTKSSLLTDGHDTIFSTSARPFVDVHVYNNPSIVTSAPITASPAVVNTYLYDKTPNVQYKETLYNAANLPSSSGAASTGTYSRPIVTDQRKFPAVSSTASPIAFTTGPLENFRTTVYQAARIPVAVSTIQPVIDTGYKTVVSSTAYPIHVNTDSFDYSQSTGYRTDSAAKKGSLDVNVSFQPGFSTQDQYDNGIPVAPVEIPSSEYPRRPSISQTVGSYDRPTIQQQVNYGSTGSSNDYSRESFTQSQGNFGQKISQGSVTSTANYATPTAVVPQQVYNVPSSTPAPAIGVTYRQPFKVVAVNYDQSTARPISQIQYKDRTSAQGYTYSKPSVKFGSSTASSISYENSNERDNYNFASKTTKGGSPTNLDISRTEVDKLVTNYDRGSVKFTPSGYETYSDNVGNGFERTSSVNRFSNQQSHSSSSGSSEHYYAGSKTNIYDKSQSGAYNRIHSTTPSYKTNTETRGYGNRVESASSDYESSNGNVEVSIKNGAVPSTTYLPSRKIASSTRRPSGYIVTTPAVTTYSGSYSRGSSTPSYEVTTASSTGLAKNKGRGKVIVKFSDLHPLLLGKLGAECTCKADPFASFRGTKPLPIESNKGRVDLRNYDESDVYVDLESSKENGDYNYDDDSSDTGAYDPAKYENEEKYETPVVAVFDEVTPKGIAAKSRRPTSGYLPASSTQRPPSSTYRTLSSTERPSSSTYLPPSSTYLPVGFAGSPSRGGVKASVHSNGDASVSASFSSARGGGFRAGKSLGTSNTNALSGQGAAFDRYGPGGLRDVDETLQGNSDCVRPGLFRHPNFCNKFYACHWDEWKKKFTLHVFNCPVHLTFDSGASACNWPSKGPACQDDNLLV